MEKAFLTLVCFFAFDIRFAYGDTRPQLHSSNEKLHQNLIFDENNNEKDLNYAVCSSLPAFNQTNMNKLEEVLLNVSLLTCSSRCYQSQSLKLETNLRMNRNDCWSVQALNSTSAAAFHPFKNMLVTDQDRATDNLLSLENSRVSIKLFSKVSNERPALASSAFGTLTSTIGSAEILAFALTILLLSGWMTN